MNYSEQAKYIKSAIEGNTGIDCADIEKIAQQYPYFVPATILLLQHSNPTPEKRQQLLNFAATSLADREALFNLVGSDNEIFKNFYPEEDKDEKKSTMDTISHFLDTFGNEDEDEVKALEQLIFNPVPDYAQLLAKEEEKSAPDENELSNENMSENDLLINKFIAKSKKQSGHFPNEEQEENQQEEISQAPAPKVTDDSSDSSLLTESLAKIYIKQHRYEKALEIIMSLSLNFPEKSVYFADQIRFLRKLITLEKYKQKKL